LQENFERKSAPAMLPLLSHYLFQKRLLFKTQQEYPGCKVVLVEENHTSKKNSMWSIMWNHESEVGWEQQQSFYPMCTTLR